jgi:hypothetical protein
MPSSDEKVRKLYIYSKLSTYRDGLHAAALEPREGISHVTMHIFWLRKNNCSCNSYHTATFMRARQKNCT